ncbi:MAG: NUDIX domain-containing protein [Verrucomicrobiae bacterium]|nr:NUDIX domain-containing protein [Verrucomicrobiae bacterium]
MITDNQLELLDVVNERDEVVAQATRGEIHRRGLMHRAVHIFVFNPAGELYLQKRSQTKDRFPGCYDSSASGHLDAGESYDACARRELREELGLEADAGLMWLFKLPASAETGWEHVAFYTWQTGATPRPNPREIESGRFHTLAEVVAMVQANPRQFADAFLKLFHHFSRAMGRG